MAAQASKTTSPSQSSSPGNEGSSPNIDIGNPYTPRRPSPIVSISINHPLATAARKIKNFLIHKQTLFSTTFTIKITPIVAIVSLLGVAAVFGGGITTAFNFGKTFEQKFLAASISPTPLQPIISPTPTILSKSGTIKATYQLPPRIPSPDSGQVKITENPSTSSAIATPTSIPTPQPILHYILVSRSGSITFLASPTSIHLQNYLNLRALITGTFDSAKNTLTVAKPEDIEILQ